MDQANAILRGMTQVALEGLIFLGSEKISGEELELNEKQGGTQCNRPVIEKTQLSTYKCHALSWHLL
jgi:hypothetical protein